MFAALRKQGKKLGAGAANKPRLQPRLQVYFQAFQDLHRRRQWHASGPQPITYQELEAYVKLKFRMLPEQVDRLVSFVLDLDDVMLADYFERHKN